MGSSLTFERRRDANGFLVDGRGGGRRLRFYSPLPPSRRATIHFERRRAVITRTTTTDDRTTTTRDDARCMMNFQRDAAGAGAPPPSRGLVFFQSARAAATPLSALAFIAERCAGLDPEHHTHETEKKERRAPPAARRGGWGRMDEEGGGLRDEEDGRRTGDRDDSCRPAEPASEETRHDTTRLDSRRAPRERNGGKARASSRG